MRPTFFLVFGVCVNWCSASDKNRTDDSPMTIVSNYNTPVSNSAFVIDPTVHHIVYQITNEGRANSSSQWNVKQTLPLVSQTFSRCNLRPINWFNYTWGQLIQIDNVQAVRWFASSPKRPLSHSMESRRRTLLRESTVDCHFLFIYSLTCPFSIEALPFIKALARAYPQFRFFAVQVQDYVAHRWSLRMLYVPKLKLITDGHILREYAGSDTDFDGLVDFIWFNTRQIPRGPLGVRSTDFQDNPPMPKGDNTFLLMASWLTVISSILYLLCAFGPSYINSFNTILHWLSCGHFGKPSNGASGTILSWQPARPGSRDR